MRERPRANQPQARAELVHGRHEKVGAEEVLIVDVFLAREIPPERPDRWNSLGSDVARELLDVRLERRPEPDIFFENDLSFVAVAPDLVSVVVESCA